MSQGKSKLIVVAIKGLRHISQAAPLSTTVVSDIMLQPFAGS